MQRFTTILLLCAPAFLLPIKAQNANIDSQTSAGASTACAAACAAQPEVPPEDNSTQFAFSESGGGRVNGCFADDAPVYPPASVFEGGNDPLAACNASVVHTLKSAAPRATIINPSTTPGWKVVTGTVRSFSGRTGSRLYEYSVARVRHTSGATGILLSVKRANNPWDRRIIREGEFNEYSPAVLQHLKFTWGDIPDIIVEGIRCWLGDCGPIFARLKNDIGPELAKLAIEAADAVANFLKDVAEQIIKFGSEVSTSVMANLKKSADQNAVNNYVGAVRDTRSAGWSLEMKIYETMRRTVANSTNPNTARALAQTIVDLK